MSTLLCDLYKAFNLAELLNIPPRNPGTAATDKPELPNPRFFWPPEKDDSSMPPMMRGLSMSDPSFRHQEDLFSLKASCEAGCELCKVFYSGFITSIENDLDLSSLEALERERVCRDSKLKQLSIWAIPQNLHPEYAPFPRAYRAIGYGRINSIPQTAPAAPVSWCAGFELEILSGSLPNWVGRHVQKHFDFQLGREWIADCMKQHSTCSSGEDRELPTRLIDVGGPFQEPRLRNTAGQRGKYVALSHCWGDSRPPKTTTKTSAKHALSIPFASLPKTFQDAVSATRRLGFQYLWIDCFCILQDSDLDWQHECASMHKTFANAAITIAGPAAYSADAGFLLKPPSAVPYSCKLTAQRKDASDVHWCVLVTKSRELNPVSQIAAESKQLNSSLAYRGWIMQERLLSSRLLFFGQRQCYFECNAADCYENLRYPVEPGDSSLLSDDLNVRKDAFSDVSVAELFRNWYIIVPAYSFCQLTERKDKLPALSGLASRYHAHTGDDYLAGLWRNGLERGLTWFRDDDSEIRRSKIDATYRPPSWTWASCDYTVVFEGFASSFRRQMESRISINSVQVNRVGIDPFGEVDGGCLSLTGTVRECILQRDPESDEEVHCLYPTWSDGDERTIGQCYVDEPEPTPHYLPDERPVTCLLLGVQSRTD